jgi:hypothetical protein
MQGEINVLEINYKKICMEFNSLTKKIEVKSKIKLLQNNDEINSRR